MDPGCKPYVCAHCLGDVAKGLHFWALEGGCVHYWREVARHFEKTIDRIASKGRK